MTRFAVALLGSILAVCAACTARDARAQAVLGTEPDTVDLWPHVRVLSDPERVLDLEQAIAMSDRFVPPKGATATLGMAKEAVWMRVPVVVSRGGEGTWVLDVDYALLRRIDVYLLEGDRVVRHATLGDGQPFAMRPMRGRSQAAPLDFAAGSSLELLLRLDTPGGKIVPMTLSRLAAFHYRALGEQLLQGALGMLGLCLLLFSLMQWVTLRENLYLKYALLVFCSTTFSLHLFGIGAMYLWTDLTWAQAHLAGVTSLLAASATALFVEEALGGELKRWLRQGLLGVAALHILLTFAYSLDLIDIQTVAVFMSTTGLAPALMGLPGAIAKARRGDSVGAWFIAAWAGYFIASAILVGVVTGRIGVNFWTMHSFQLGATLDMLVFMRIALLRTATRHREAQRAAEERDALHSLAHSDPLTGLLNRRGFDDALATALTRATSDRFLALYVLDLDGFKAVNDQFGHDVGDALLRVAAQRLRASVRAGDSVARLGGDEFVVMAESLTAEAQAIDLGRKLLDAFRAPFALDEHSCGVSATIGYVLAPTDASDANALLKAADAAMYAGKQEGKDRLVRVPGS